ncbi:PQQ-dependent sugar dehydrogenase [Oceanospirillum beijerinckii]|uniref:PQQ-dependent sugar dehydrogenase n=1 Tax=Oceanospirillum beijerinckii TaxID=64976 RepID=UPI0006842807|nr:PQQ-dependent sugar dehydrogenase [Oceanospirillum beijerinckii]MAC47255.1 dehydrogenase [Oceanospirillum sp.]
MTLIYRYICSAFILLSCIAFLNPAQAAQYLFSGKSEGMNFQLEKVISGLGVPWALEFLDDDQLLFTERGGKVGLLDITKAQVRYLLGVPEVTSYGQGGLLDLKKSPNFFADQTLFFTYSSEDGRKRSTALASAQWKGGRLQGWRDVLVTQSKSGSGHHFGSRIAFDALGYLYFSVGDRGDRESAQDLTNHAGSILRIEGSGAVPMGNPFIKSKGALPEIWSYGHRNPQGLAFDENRGVLWAIEHGPRGGDELNRIRKGANYGWPVISYGKEYWAPISVGEGTHKVGMEQPEKVYIPSIAPGSLLLYSGQAFPEWQGDLFAGALALQHLNHLKLNQSGQVLEEERLLLGLSERIRALAESPQGWLYLSTDEGNIYRIRPE